MSRSRNLKAFTLIEVLVVVAIIALLVSILLPSLNRARDNAMALVCKTRLEQLYKGHNLYAHDNKNHFPEPDWWLWDGAGGSMRTFYPNLYARTGGSRPSDSSRWVEFGQIYKYVRDKEVYFCPKDTKRRSGNAIGGAMAGGSADHGYKAIHSYVRFVEPHEYYRLHLTNNGSTPAADDIVTPYGTLRRSDFLRMEDLRPGCFEPFRWQDSTLKLDTRPSRLGLMFEEWQNFGEPPFEIPGNRENQLNDGYSGFTYYDDYLSLRHMYRSHISYWDGHIELVDAKRANKDQDNFGASLIIGYRRK